MGLLIPSKTGVAYLSRSSVTLCFFLTNAAHVGCKDTFNFVVLSKTGNFFSAKCLLLLWAETHLALSTRSLKEDLNNYIPAYKQL